MGRIAAALLGLLLVAMPVSAQQATERTSITSGRQTEVACAVTSTSVLAALDTRNFLVISNISDTTIHVVFNATATVSKGLQLAAGQTAWFDTKVPIGTVTCIHGGSGSKTLRVIEGVK